MTYHLFQLLYILRHGLLLGHVTQCFPGIPFGLLDDCPECRFTLGALALRGLLEK